MASDVQETPSLEDLEEGECSDDDEAIVDEASGEQAAETAPSGGVPENLIPADYANDVENTGPIEEGEEYYGEDNNGDVFEEDGQQNEMFVNDKVMVESSRERRDSDRRDSGGDHGGSAGRRESNGGERKHKKNKRHRSRSRERDRDRDREKRHHKKSKKRDREEDFDPDDEKAKKKFMLKRMKALEGVMGIMPEEEEMEDEKAGSAATPAASSASGSLPERKFPKRFCNLFMQGKCPRDPADCLYSHDIDVPKVWELCKFYVYDRCAKRDKCLYLHKEFPCKYYHLGLECGESDVTCMFSHQPLTPKLKSLLIKHVETGPKELLGDFQRMSRPEAISAIMATEARHNGWEYDQSEISVGQASGAAGGWGSGSEEGFESNPALMLNMMNAVTAEGGFNNGRAAADMNNMMSSMIKNMIQQKFETMKNSFGEGLNNGGGGSKPADLMSIKVNEKTAKKALKRIKSEQSASPQDDDLDTGILRSDSFGDQHQEDGGSGGDETPDITPPVSPSAADDEFCQMDERDTNNYCPNSVDRYGSPGQRSGEDNHMYTDQFGRNVSPHSRNTIRGFGRGSKWGVAPVLGRGGVAPVLGRGGVAPVLGRGGGAPVLSRGGVAPVLGRGRAHPPRGRGGGETDYYDHCDRQSPSNSGESPNQNWSPKSNQRRASIDSNGGNPNSQNGGHSPTSRVNTVAPKVDPRKAKRAIREQQEARAREEVERLEQEKEQRMLDIDLGDVLGDLDLPMGDDLDLPPLTVSDAPLSPQKSLISPLLLPPPALDLLTSPRGSIGSGIMDNGDLTAGGLPFKPHMMQMAREIEASLHTHDPIAWILRPVDVNHRDYSAIVMRHGGLSAVQMDLDPRLRRYSTNSTAAYTATTTVLHSSPGGSASPLARQQSFGTPQSPPILSQATPPLLPPAQPKPVKVDPRLNRARKT